ncbi:MAG: hypothetical protein ACMUHY_06415 [Thermoplasmatota archaeon]
MRLRGFLRRREGIRSLVTLATILLTFTLVPIDQAESKIGPEEPDIIITMPPDHIKIRTGPGMSGVTKIDVPITIIKPIEAQGDTVTVDLWYIRQEDDLGISMMPDTLVFPANGNRTMDFVVEMEFSYDPMNRTSYINGYFQIEGNWRYENLAGNGRVIPESGIVDIVPFLRTEADPTVDSSSVTADVGEWMNIWIAVNNNGNAQVHITVSVAEVPKDVELYIDTPTLTINPFGHEMAKLKVRQESGKGRDIDITVRLKTKYLTETETDEVTVELHTETDGNPMFGSTSLIISVLSAIFLGLMIFSIFLFIRDRRSK